MIAENIVKIPTIFCLCPAALIYNRRNKYCNKSHRSENIQRSKAAFINEQFRLIFAFTSKKMFSLGLFRVSVCTV